MAYEELVPRRGAHTRSASVSVAWRKARTGGNLLVITLGAEVCEQINLKQGMTVRVERETTLNRMRLYAFKENGWKPAWKSSKARATWCASLLLPLPDVVLAQPKPAQAVRFEYIEGGLEVRLPPWVAPAGFIKVPAAA